MIYRLGSVAAQTRALIGVTLAAGGGWISSPPGWGCGRGDAWSGGR
jgi:hypothetical protein